MSDNNSANPSQADRLFPETGQVVRGAFLDFLNRYGLDLCGYPVTGESLEQGRPVQFFQNLALEQPEPGVVRPVPIGVELLAARAQLRRQYGEAGTGGQRRDPLPPPPVALDNQVGQLAVHPTDRYPQRGLDEIRWLVIHRTGAPAEVGPETIAEYHVNRQGWPGIGYHFVVGPDGHVWQTNGLVTISNHARQFNASAVGIALTGSFGGPPPPDAQLEAAARLSVWLLDSLHLPLEAVQGHCDLTHTTCPGSDWLDGPAWGRQLQAQIRSLLGLPPEPAAEVDAPVDLPAGVQTPEPVQSAADPTA